MRAEYDSQVDALDILLGDVEQLDGSDEVHPRGRVGLLAGGPVDVEVLYTRKGIEEPLKAAAVAYGLDLEALLAAARSAMAAPDRLVTLEVAAPSPA